MQGLLGQFARGISLPGELWDGKPLRFTKLLESIRKWNTINIAAELAHKSVKWRFNQSSALHQSGIWEKLILRFKQRLHSILGSCHLRDKVLNTIFRLVEYPLNSRPLTLVIADTSDLGAMTLTILYLINKQHQYYQSLASTS